MAVDYLKLNATGNLLLNAGGKLKLNTSTVGIEFDAASNSGYQTASSYSWSHTVAGNDRYIVVGIAVFKSGGIGTQDLIANSVTYDGVALKLIYRLNNAHVNAELWGLTAPNVGTHTVAVSVGLVSADSVAMATSLEGVHQGIPHEGANGAIGTGASDASVTVKVTAADDWVIDCVASEDTAITVGANQTSRNSVSGTLGSGGQSTEVGPAVAPDDVIMSWGAIASPKEWAICGVALRPIKAVEASPLLGSAAITLGALTTTATGTLDIAGTASITLGALTTTATGALALSATSAITLDNATSSATGTLAIGGTASITFGALTTTATGALALSATSAITLGDATSTATGTLDIAGAASITFGALTTAATGTLALSATSAITLGDATSTATGTLDIAGTASITFGALTTSGTGTLALSATSSITLGDATAVATGTLDLTGVAAITLGALTTTATGTVDIAGSAAITLGELTLLATGTLEVVGVADITLGALVTTATGTIVNHTLGTAAITFGLLTVSSQPPPKRCCPMWPCEYVQVTIGPTGSAKYNCGAGLIAFPAGNAMLKRVVADPDYHRWEYRSENETGGVTQEITIECDMTKVDEGKGPCPYLTYYYNNHAGLEVGFGPLLMDLRQCACIDEPDPVPSDSVGYNWGQAYVTADAINAADQSAFACTLHLDSGDDSPAICLCSGACPCFGFSKRLLFVWACSAFSAPASVNLDWYDAASLPPGAQPPGGSLPYGLWWGQAIIDGCRLEVMYRCTAAGPELWFLGFPDAVGGDACDLAYLACTSPNRCPVLSQCRTETLPFIDQFNYRFASDCTGTIYSTQTLTER